MIKLEGEGPVDNRPSTDQLHNIFQFFSGYVGFSNVKKIFWHVTGDIRHVTCDGKVPKLQFSSERFFLVLFSFVYDSFKFWFWFFCLFLYQFFKFCHQYKYLKIRVLWYPTIFCNLWIIKPVNNLEPERGGGQCLSYKSLQERRGRAWRLSKPP